MVVDSSALVAILLGEPDCEVFETALLDADRARLSAASLVEASIVVESRLGSDARGAVADLVAALDIEIAAFTKDHAQAAIEAFRRFGKGRHPAALNICDCMAYALAAATGEPLLYKGEDFAKTDIESALYAPWEDGMDLGLKGKWAIVCASSKGLGKGCAAALAAEGVNLVINARTADALEATAAELRGSMASRCARWPPTSPPRTGAARCWRRAPSPTSWSTTPAARRRGCGRTGAMRNGPRRSSRTC
jgi:ribonuclease VapC